MATDLTSGQDVARAIAMSTLGHDPGPLAAAASMSHQVYVGAEIVVELLDARRHSRLDREIALASSLPSGLTAPLLSSGHHRVDGHRIRYACYARAPGVTPGMGLPGVDEATARSLAAQAIERLSALHDWVPAGAAERTLRHSLDHGGFLGRAELLAEIDALARADRDGLVSPALIDGLTTIAQKAPPAARTVLPVHADCHWGNWLVSGGRVTALLDFEWARFGEPIDDWFFVIADSGPHADAALDVVARETGASPESLRADCEIREAALPHLRHPPGPAASRRRLPANPRSAPDPVARRHHGASLAAPTR